MSLIIEALQIPLFQRAVLAGLLASVACGVIGSLVVVKRMASVSGGLSHAAFGGVGLGYLLGFSPLLGAAGFCLLSSLVIAYLYRKQHQALDTVITIIWSFGMALGLLFIALTPGYAPDLMSYLFGSILLVPQEYLIFLAIIDLLIVGSVIFLFSGIQAVCFDEEFSEVMGAPVGILLLVIFSLTALTVVILMQVVGVILTIALLTLPAVVMHQWSSTLKEMMLGSVILTALLIALGLFFSYFASVVFLVELPTGSVIILFAACAFLVSTILKYGIFLFRK